MTGFHEIAGFSEFRMRVVVRYLTPVVVVAGGDERITVIRCTRDQVQLVAAARPHFDVPELTLEIDGQPEHIAVAQRPDLPIDPVIVDRRCCMNRN